MTFVYTIFCDFLKNSRRFVCPQCKEFCNYGIRGNSQTIEFLCGFTFTIPDEINQMLVSYAGAFTIHGGENDPDKAFDREKYLKDNNNHNKYVVTDNDFKLFYANHKEKTFFEHLITYTDTIIYKIPIVAL